MTNCTTLSESEMISLWELHTQLEFATKDAAATVATMTPDNSVNHVPVMTGGRGRDELIDFYGKHFIPKMPRDTGLRLLARTVGKDRLIDEFVFSFTHDIAMDWMLPGVELTPGKSKSRWWSWCSSRETRLPANASTGINPPSSLKSGYWIQPGCQLPASSRHANSRTIDCRQMN